MRNNFYNAWATRHNIPDMNDKLTAAGVALPATKGALALESELIAVLGQDAGKAAIRKAWNGTALEAVAVARMQQALNVIYYEQDLGDFPADTEDDEYAVVLPPL